MIRLGAAAVEALTLRDLVEAYRRSPAWTERRESKRKDEPRIAYWIDSLGGLPITDITTALIARHRDDLSRRFAASTVAGYLAALSAIYKAAGEHYDGVANPVKVRRPRNRLVRLRYLSDAEFERLIDAAGGVSDRLLAMVLAALSCGARCSELMSIRWQDLDLERGTAVLRPDDAKTGHLRTLRFRGAALEALRQLPRISVWLWGGGTRPPAWPRKQWDEARAAAALEDFRWHDLRHTSATWLAMQGAGGPEVQMHLGHRSLAITNKYVHLAAGQRSDIGPMLVPRYY
ncbi:MAG: site-specific integrase [Thermoanaerobaculia bacterium]|nr:site-specific integrase [Thermoanaerobaculia bacterium]